MNNLFSAQSIGSFLDRTRDATPESSSAGSVSFEAVAQGWADLGLHPGDLILLCLPNSIVLLEQFLGALHGGLVPVLIAPNTPSTRIRELAHFLRARAVAAPRLNSAALSGRQVTLGTLDACLFEDRAPSLTRPGEAVLMTSGTSGFASGCIFGIDQLLLNAQRHAKSIGQRPDDTVLVNLPLHYSFALVAQTLATLVCGGRLVIDGPPFHPARYERTISQFGVTVSSLTPIVVRSLLQADQWLATGGPRVLTVGGDSLVREDVSRLLERRPGKELYLTYGLSQAGPRVSTLAAHAEPATRYGSVGRPLEGTQVSLEPFDGNAGIKELKVSSATVMRRRIGMVEGRPPLDESILGRISTGDIFEQDSDGYLYFQGRLSDFIVRKGEKICLAAVRRVAAQLPHAMRAATQIIRSESGEEDFELTLYVSAPSNDYTNLLRKRLRHTEMPRNIRIELSDREVVHGHK